MKPFLFLILMLPGVLPLLAQNKLITPSKSDYSLNAQAKRSSFAGDEWEEDSYDELKTHLALTEAQMQRLEDIQRRQSEAESPIYEQISKKWDAVDELFRTNSNDAYRVGALMIEIQKLEKSLPLVEPYRTEALNVLAPNQKGKLPILANAIKLQGISWQAANLNLIDGDPDRKSSDAPGPPTATAIPPDTLGVVPALSNDTQQRNRQD